MLVHMVIKGVYTNEIPRVIYHLQQLLELGQSSLEHN
jgi:hypothetical protein